MKYNNQHNIYFEVFRHYPPVKEGLKFNDFKKRLLDIRFYMYMLAPNCFKEREKPQELYSYDFFQTVELKFTHEQWIKPISQLFGVRTLWVYGINYKGETILNIKAIGLHNQVRAFFRYLEFVLSYMITDRKVKHYLYNKKLRKYRKIQRKWPGKMVKPPKFIDFYSKRENKIQEDTRNILNNLLEDISKTTGLPFYDQIDFYMEEMNLTRRKTTTKLKINRSIW